jgi:hypothetical protein
LLVVAGVVGFIDFVPVLLNTLRIKRTNGSGFSKKIQRTGSFHERRKEPTKNWQFKVGPLTQFFDILKHCSSMYYNFFRKLVMGWVPELIFFDF